MTLANLFLTQLYQPFSNRKLRKQLLAVLIIVVQAPQLYAQQNKTDFNLVLPKKKTANSLYSSVEVIDSRYDTTSLGRLWCGIINNINAPVPALALTNQVKRSLTAAIGNDAQQNEMLVQIRFFKFTNSYHFGSDGYCFFRANFYKKLPSGYTRVYTADTALHFIISDMTSSPQKFFRQCGESLNEILTGALTKPAIGDSLFSMFDLLHLDSMEKRQLPVYNTTSYKDGIYKNYHSFKVQQPDYAVASIDTTGETLKDVRGISTRGKQFKVKTKETYAVINEGIIYVATPYGFSPVIKIGDDFFLVGEAMVAGSISEKKRAIKGLTGMLLRGGAGGLLYGSVSGGLEFAINKMGFRKKFEMKIDHIDGIPIKLKEVETEEEKTKEAETSGKLKETENQE